MRCIFVCCVLFCCLNPGALAQTQSESQRSPAAPPAIDPEYRRLDELASTLRARNEKQYAISSPKGISESNYITIGGIEQWVTIHGQNRDNPVLLFLHGGPGDVTSSWSFALFAPWERQFAVVQWDERGSGRTLEKTAQELRRRLPWIAWCRTASN